MGIFWGIHFIVWVQLTFLYPSHPMMTTTTATDETTHVDAKRSLLRVTLLWQWCVYVMSLCTFHLLEFFITVMYNPTQATADSYLVNHSLPYTAAVLTSWMEFWIRYIFVPSINLPYHITHCLGPIMVIGSQGLRTLAMKTAGESFHHYIQTHKKDNHVLVTHGIYHYLRHPSYVGFFYFSIATQLVLGNILHAMAFGIVSFQFFQRRIAYEEEQLCTFFPKEYPNYRQSTWMGIPFLQSTTTVVVNHENHHNRNKTN